MADATVKTIAAGESSASQTPSYRQSISSELIVPEWYFQLTREGRVFSVSNATNGTALAVGGTAFSDTAPAFSIDVPAGTTMIPLKAMLHQGGTVAGGVITVLMAYDAIQRYSSGGTQLTVRNNRTDSLVSGSTAPASVAKAYQGATLAAFNTNAMNFFGDILVQGVTNTAASILAQRVDWSAGKDGPLLEIVGPGSWVIWTFAAVTQPSWFFRFDWAEIPTAVAKQ